MTQSQDSVNDIIQYCHFKGLKNELVNFCDQILNLINDIIGQNSSYNSEQVELLINNFGGMLQTVIVRIEQQFMSPDLIQKLFSTLTNLCNHDSCRQGVLFILNGILNTVNQEQCIDLSDTVLNIIDTTVHNKAINGGEYPFDSSSKRLATGLIQDLATAIDKHVSVHLQKITNLLFTILGDNDIGTDVKITAIIAIGDICLVTELSFQPFLE